MRVFVIFLTAFFSLYYIQYSIFPAYAHSQTVIIKMTANGFEPAEVTLDIDSTIIFLNQDKVQRWPASNIHPTHELYPEFDPKKPVEPGKDWTFKPKKAGSFKFHDHLFPHMRGVLIVKKESGLGVDSNRRGDSLFEKIKSSITVILSRFASLTVNSAKNIIISFPRLNRGQDDSVDFASFSKLSPDEQIKTISDMAKKKGVEKTWQFIKETFKNQGGSSGNIHDLAHLTGSLIYETKGFSGITICSADFAFGCYHGFLDKAFEKSLNDLEKAEEACGRFGAGGPFASCVHGIGHGVASFYQTSDIKNSLLSCKRLSQNASQYCFDGVFMEFERSAPQSFYSKDDPYKPCDDLEREFGPVYSFACGRNQTTVLLSRFKFSFEDLTGVCLGAKSPQFKAACIDSLGFIVARSSQDAGYIVETCKKIGVSEYIANCSKTAAGELIFQDTPEWKENSFKVCASVPETFQEECRNYLEKLIKEYGRDENSFLREQLRVCYGNRGIDDCYKKAAQVLFERFGLKKSLNLLAENENYPEVYARCHEVTHFLSRSEYERLNSIAGVYAECNSTCHGGCYHGTLEAYLQQKNLDGEKLKTEFGKACGSIENYNSPLVFNECLHGLGHAAMYVTDTELLLSLALCDQIKAQDGKERCYSGAFMENSSSSTNRDHPGKYVKADDPMYPCNSLEEKYLKLCWRYQSSYFSIISNTDWKKVVSLCKQVPDKYQEECFRTIGTNQVGFTADIKKMKDDCKLVPEEFQNVCISGVVSSFSYRFVGDSSKMINFCSIVDSSEKEACFKQIGLGVLDWSGNIELAKKECTKIPDPKGASLCMSVI